MPNLTIEEEKKTFVIQGKTPLKLSRKIVSLRCTAQALLFSDVFYMFPGCGFGQYNIALFAFRFSFGQQDDIPDPVQEEQYSDNSYTEVLLFLHACSQAVLLDESNIALFASRFTFCHLGDIPLKQSRRNNDLTTLLRRFCCFYM